MIVKVLGNTIYLDKSGQYKCEVRYMDEYDEIKRITRTHPSKNYIKKFIKDYPKGEYYPDCTLDELFDNVYQFVLMNETKNTSYIKKINTFYSVISPVFGGFKMKTILKEDLQQFFSALSEKYSEVVLKDCFVLMKDIFDHYSEFKEPKKNAMRDVLCPVSAKKKKEKKSYTSEEIKKIFAVADAVNSETNRPRYMHGNAVKLMLLTDMKLGEILALTWSDVDFNNGTITVNKTSSEINYSEYGKTDYSIQFKPLGKNRIKVISITPEIESVLKSIRKSNTGSEYVVSQKDGSPVSKSYYSRVMRNITQEALMS